MSAKFSGVFPVQLESTTAPAAPAFATDSTKLCASKFSPRKATNNSPCLSVRESVLILSIEVFPCPDETAAPANSAISRIDNRFMRTPLDGLRSRAARLEYHRTGRCDRRTPDNSRALCLRSTQCRAAAPAQWRGQSPPFDRQFFRSEEHTSELQSQSNLVCRLLLEKKKNNTLNTKR